MDRWSQRVGCLLLVSLIAGCARYAYGREKLRATNLQSMYAQINADSFGGELPDAEVTWSDLGEDYGGTYYGDDFRIEIDRAIATETELTQTMEHEACHVQTIPLLNGEDEHGSLFQECMKRFDRKY
jgi:predicted SprT family Zn-dependent metalloprotease